MQFGQATLSFGSSFCHVKLDNHLKEEKAVCYYMFSLVFLFLLGPIGVLFPSQMNWESEREESYVCMADRQTDSALIA